MGLPVVMVELQAQDAPAVVVTPRDAAAEPVRLEALAIPEITQQGPVAAVMVQRVTVEVVAAHNNYK
jgi:hypothetical protein